MLVKWARIRPTGCHVFSFTVFEGRCEAGEGGSAQVGGQNGELGSADARDLKAIAPCGVQESRRGRKNVRAPLIEVTMCFQRYKS